MKYIGLLFLVIFIASTGYSQNKVFQMTGKVLGLDSKPVADANIINYKNTTSAVSISTGDFNMWVEHGDSLVVTHLAFNNKVIHADSLLTDPIVYLSPLTRNILEVDVSPSYKTDYELARENLNSMSELRSIRVYKIIPEPNPVMQMAIENSRVMRTNASKINLINVTPQENK
jgi:hypothetical protein